MRLLGLDPGLQKTGWGIVEAEGSRLRHVANGVVKSDAKKSLSDRLVELHSGLTEVLDEWKPQSCAVEETFVNKNPTSTLKLGQARGIALLVPAQAGLTVAEYTPNHVKNWLLGQGMRPKNKWMPWCRSCCRA